MARSRNSTALALALGGSAVGALCVLAIVFHVSSSSSAVVEMQRTQKLWNAAHNDAVMPAGQSFDGRDAKRVTKHIQQWQDMADSQGDTPVSYKGVMTQKLFMLPQMQTTQQLWNAAHNDAVMPAGQSFDGRDAKRVTKHIQQWQDMADSQGDTPVSYKGVMTQKLYIVPQANVLTGSGQKMETGGKEDVQAEKKAESKAAAKVVAKSAAPAKKQPHLQALFNAAQEHDGSALFPHHVHFAKGVPLQGKYYGYDASKQVSYLPSAQDKARTQLLWDAATNDQSLASTRAAVGGSGARHSAKQQQRDMSGVPRNYLAGMDYHPPNYLGGYGW